MPTASDALRDHLVRARIAGDVATTRRNNIGNLRRALDGDEGVTFGIEFAPDWTFESLLALMADRAGIHSDEAYDGVDTLDPDRTIERLGAMRDRIRRAAQGRERVLFATGHPVNLLPVHLRVADALRAAGCEVLRGAGDGVKFVLGVHAIGSHGNLLHTHSPEPIRQVLASIDTPPALVIADHGWAGGAAQLAIDDPRYADVDVVGFADCNDPGLFVGEAQGAIVATVPLDDGIAPHEYDPLIDFLVDGL
jgi:hypothetical protein